MLMKRSPNFGFWHKPDVRPLADLGLLTGALPTFRAQFRLNFGYRSDQSQWIKLIHGLVQDHGPVGRTRRVNSA